MSREAQPAQTLPFGVGGGLVAIKTLLSRDPCVHANTVIQMIDAILAEQPAPVQQEPCCHAGIAHDCHAGPGCRIVKRLKAAPQPAPVQQEPDYVPGHWREEALAWREAASKGMKQPEQAQYRLPQQDYIPCCTDKSCPKCLAAQPAQQQEPDAIVTSLTAGPDGVARSGLDRELPLMAGVYLAPQPAQQEPVAGLLVGQDSDGRYVSIAAKAHADTLPLGEYKLYTSPQPAQRTWVGLTDDEAQAAVYDESGCVVDYENYAEAIEAKLKEKNT